MRLCRLTNVRRPRAPVTIQGGGAIVIRQVHVAYTRDGTSGARVIQRRVPDSMRIPPGKSRDGLPETFGQLPDVQRQVRLGWLGVEYYDQPASPRAVEATQAVPATRNTRRGNKR